MIGRFDIELVAQLLHCGMQRLMDEVLVDRERIHLPGIEYRKICHTPMTMRNPLDRHNSKFSTSPLCLETG